MTELQSLTLKEVQSSISTSIRQYRSQFSPVTAVPLWVSLCYKWHFASDFA